MSRFGRSSRKKLPSTIKQIKWHLHGVTVISYFHASHRLLDSDLTERNQRHTSGVLSLEFVHAPLVR